MAMTAAQKQDAYKFFIVSFGAVPGVEYMNQIADAYSVGLTTKEIVNIYSTKPQFEAIYPRFQNNEQFAAKLIENVVGASATDAAKAQAKTDVVAALNAGWSKGDVVFQIFTNLSNKPAGDADWGKTAAMLANKAEVAEYLTETLLVNSLDLEALGAPLKGVTDDAATVQAAKDNGMNNSQTYTLTNGADKATANVFEAGQVYTPGGNDRINSLQNDDVLTGTGDNPTLNVVLGNPNDNGINVITPTLAGIETINARFDATNAGAGAGGVAAAGMVLDLQDSTGVKAVNITRIADGQNATVQNITDPVETLSVANSQAPNGNVTFNFLNSAVAAADNSVKLDISNVNVANLTVQARGATPTEGFETINLSSKGADNTIGTLVAEDLQTLNITGDQSLTLGGVGVVTRAGAGTTVEAVRAVAGLANVAGSLTKVDASALEGDFVYNIGNEINAGLDGTSGKSVDLEVIGGKGNNTFNLTNGASIDAADKISGGEGGATLITYGGTSNIAGTGNITKVDTLEIRTGQDGGTAADAVTINANAFTDLQNIYVRNEGQDVVFGAWQSAIEGMTVNLNNLTAAQAGNITLAHGTTGNSTIVNNVVNVTFAAAGTANAARVTLVDGVNQNPVFNAQLDLASAELVTIVDSDTESNTIHLNQGAFTQAGSTITLQGGAAGQYLNLDTVRTAVNGPIAAPVAAAATNNGYGRFTDGTAADNTTVLTAASAAAVQAGGAATRDAAAATVFYGAAGVADAGAVLGDGFVRHAFENLEAGDYAGNVEIRLGDVTRADGVSSQRLVTGAGNDTFIFDAVGTVNAGFTSGDTITAGAGTDTLVLDGNTATIPGTPRIDHQTSEWDNLSGIDVLRFGNNAGVANVGNGAQVANAGGAYYARIDNDFVSQTDAGDRLTIINNDGDLNNNSESDLVLDLRGLSQDKWVTFVGANGNGNAGISSNRIVVDDISANRNMILNGGDTDVRVNTTAGYVAGNNNVYEVRNTANVSINDLAQTSNFGLINFTNDQAVAQTLTLTLNNTVIEALVDSSSTATTAATQEILSVVATDNGAVASALNIDARAVTGFHALNVTGSAAGNDVLTLNNNLGGTANVVDLGASLGDRVNWTGGAAGTAVTIDLGADGNAGGVLAGNGFATFQLGAVTTTHDIDNVEIVDLTGLTYATATVAGTAAAETFIGGAGVDTFTGNGGANRFVVGNNDTVTDFVSGTDVLDLAVAGTVANYSEAVDADLGAAFGTAASLVAAQAAYLVQQAVTPLVNETYTFIGNSNAGGVGGYLFVDANNDGAADSVILLTGIGAAGFAFTDIV